MIGNHAVALANLTGFDFTGEREIWFEAACLLLWLHVALIVFGMRERAGFSR